MRAALKNNVQYKCPHASSKLIELKLEILVLHGMRVVFVDFCWPENCRLLSCFYVKFVVQFSYGQLHTNTNGFITCVWFYIDVVQNAHSSMEMAMLNLLVFFSQNLTYKWLLMESFMEKRGSR